MVAGDADVGLSDDQAAQLKAMALRTTSDPDVDPTTGAELGMDAAGDSAPGTDPKERQ